MEPAQTKHMTKKRYHAIMWLCFLYGGFAIFLFLLDLYTIIWSGRTFFSMPGQGREFDFNGPPRIDMNAGAAPLPQTFSPLRIIASPFSILILISGIISVLAGITIWQITREKEIKKIRQDAADMFLLPDEKKVIDALKKNNYSLIQSQITKDTGLNKVQVHRVIKRLQSKELIEKHEYGLTNKIVLKKELFE